LGIDALVIVLAAKYSNVFWIFPPLVTALSLAGAALTYWVGRTTGDAGLPRLIPAHHLERIRTRLNRSGSGTLAIAAVLPPPFPLTPVLLTCGALHLDRSRFLFVFGTMRLVRFAAVALLARYYGDRLVRMFDANALLQIVNVNSLHTIINASVSLGVTAAIALAIVASWRYFCASSFSISSIT
jgi:membrane protein YqaA with SNARE-associated domain